MEAIIAIGITLLPAIIYFVRTPYRPQNEEVLMYLIGIWIALTAAIYIGNWLFPPRGGAWAAGIAWVAMCWLAWNVTSNELEKRAERKSGSNGNSSSSSR